MFLNTINKNQDTDIKLFYEIQNEFLKYIIGYYYSSKKLKVGIIFLQLLWLDVYSNFYLFL